MGRKSNVNYWESRGGFFCWHQGKQVLLASGPNDGPDGPTYKEAFYKFIELTHGRPPGMTLADGVQRYLEWLKNHRAPGTCKIKQDRLAAVCARLGSVNLGELTLQHVETWWADEPDRRGWTDTTTQMTLKSLQSFMNWSVKRGMLPRNPLQSLEMPTGGSRGLECVLTPDQEEAAVNCCKGAARDLLITLRDTGARPGEIIHAQAKDYDRDLRALVYQAIPSAGRHKHKTARTGKPRVIYLVGDALATVDRLANERPNGPLFLSRTRKRRGPERGMHGEWTRSCVRHLVVTIRRKIGMKGFVLYSFRHSFAVRWLRAEKPVMSLAEVLGTSVQMIQHHYGHLADQRDYLRRLVEEMHAARPKG